MSILYIFSLKLHAKADLSKAMRCLLKAQAGLIPYVFTSQLQRHTRHRSILDAFCNFTPDSSHAVPAVISSLCLAAGFLGLYMPIPQ